LQQRFFIQERLTLVATFPKATFAAIFLVGSPGEILIQAFHEPAQIMKPLTPLTNDVQSLEGFPLLCLSLDPTLHDKRTTEQLHPALRNLLICQVQRLLLIDAENQMVVIGHHGISTEIDSKDLRQGG
jgi:hypothetical protein